MPPEPSLELLPVAPAPNGAIASPEARAAASFFDKAQACLHGRGEAQDDGMAAASFLDASDLGHAEASIMAALLYYTGIGVSRSTSSAAEYARKYLALAPQGTHAGTARDIASEALGTENARRVLYGEAAPQLAAREALQGKGKRKLVLLGATAVVGVLAIIGLGVAFSSGSATSLSDQKIDIASLIPDAERDAAHQQALAIAAGLKSEALALMKKADDEDSARLAAEAASAESARLAAEKAEQDAQQEQAARLAQSQAAQAQAQAAEAQSRAQAAEAQARSQAAQSQARNAQSQSQTAQLRTMYASALEAMRRGEYDRATGLADAMLSMAPNNGEIQTLKNTIQQNRKQAISRMRAE